MSPEAANFKVFPGVEKCSPISVSQNSSIDPIAREVPAGTVHHTYPRRTP